MNSFISGITLLGLPTEVYSFGVQYLYVIGGVILMGIVMGQVYLPVFHDLNITSTYEVYVIGVCVACFVMHINQIFQWMTVSKCMDQGLQCSIGMTRICQSGSGSE